MIKYKIIYNNIIRVFNEFCLTLNSWTSNTYQKEVTHFLSHEKHWMMFISYGFESAEFLSKCEKTKDVLK